MADNDLSKLGLVVASSGAAVVSALNGYPVVANVWVVFVMLFVFRWNWTSRGQ